MANQNVKMSKFKRAFQLLAANVPQREICEKLHMGRGVLTRYKNIVDERKISYVDLSRMSNEDIEQFLKSTKPAVLPSDQKKTLEELLPEYVSDLAHNRYLTILKLHEQYKKDFPDGYEYTQFKKAIRDYQYAHNLSYHNTYLPGEEIQIDFAGDLLYLTDSLTGEITPVVVLVCILPYSGLGFAKAMYNASMEHFFCGLSDAFTYIGGVTRKAKSDNMKQWVKRSDRYEPVFSDAAMEWSVHYNTALEACRVRKPRDKGPVEGLVKKVYNAVYSVLRNEVFHNLNSMNTRMLELMDEFNSKPSRTTGRSRMDIFLSEEKPLLEELPQAPYRFRYRKEVKLTPNYHIEVSKHHYSVPYQFVGQQVVVVWDIETVEVYSGTKRIAIHERKPGYGYSTLDEHMPEEHLAYKHGQGYNAAYYQEEAELIGPHTLAAVNKLLKRDSHVEYNYRACMGVLSLRKAYGRERVERACERLSTCPSITYTMIKNILKNNLDKVAEQKPATQTPFNDDVRGAESFNRLIESCIL